MISDTADIAPMEPEAVEQAIRDCYEWIDFHENRATHLPKTKREERAWEIRRHWADLQELREQLKEKAFQ